MKNKYFLVLLSCFIVNISFAEDYSQGNTNPYAKYEYHRDFEQDNNQNNGQNNSQSKNVGSYFSNKIKNPIKLREKNNTKNSVTARENNVNTVSGSSNGCWDRAGLAYGVDPWLLFSIAKVESEFRSNVINWNKNKSVDIGMMQINSMWLPTLKSFGISVNDLFEPCTSVFVGAWIVAQNIRKFGYNMDGIGAYNSPTNKVIRRNYAKKVYAAYYELTNKYYILSQR
jgi:soluble lytic murein transglycosylase-like protein